MDNTKSSFDYSKNEVEEYFSFLEMMEYEDVFIKYKKDEQIFEEKVSNKIQTIFIANAFLILYNLIESTIRNSIIDIYEKINEDELSYDKLSDNLKNIWVTGEVLNLKEGNYHNDTLSKNIVNIAQNILTKEIIQLSKEDIKISGNIDAQKIRDLAKNIGFRISPNGRNLEEIKDKRQRLAHGEQTFYDVGKDFTFNELNAFKQETFDYLLDVIGKIENFITQQGYTNN
jgi:hypothetical protein